MTLDEELQAAASDFLDGMGEEVRDEPPDLNVRRLVDPRSLPARFHNLRAAGLCGAAALYSFQGDNTETLAKRLGSGTHALITGKPCVLWDQPAKSGKGKAKRDPRSEAWKAFGAAHPGAVILNAKEMDAAKRMAAALMDHHIAGPLLSRPGMLFERSIIWSQNGRTRQSTPDARDGEVNCEIKTTRCAAPWAFTRDVKKMAYHAQVADQRAAIKHETGKAPRHSYIIAVESSRPHVVQVYELTEATLDKGDQLLEIWMDKLQMYETCNLWGGYSERIEPLELTDPFEATIADPDWATGDGCV